MCNGFSKKIKNKIFPKQSESEINGEDKDVYTYKCHPMLRQRTAQGRLIDIETVTRVSNSSVYAARIGRLVTQNNIIVHLASSTNKTNTDMAYHRFSEEPPVIAHQAGHDALCKTQDLSYRNDGSRFGAGKGQGVQTYSM